MPDQAPSAPSTNLGRRDALTLIGGAAVAVLASSTAAQPDHDGASISSALALGWDAAKGEYALPRLPYAYDALEPHIDKQTMEIHHTKHHQGYVNGLNKALAELKKARESGDYGLAKHWSREVSFHGGGHINHCLFWITMAPAGHGGGGEPVGGLAEAIARDFGSYDAFRKHFEAAAGQVEGSGWAWLVYDRFSGRLIIQQMEKQQDLLLTAAAPLLGCDVWEHAYYLKHQNRRGEYVKAWFNVINWSAVDRLYEHARRA